ncbi:secretory lipase-domain-containing protein [Aspergillus cavernicola]|uniref:Secretory lipase-domain-containing protein n=1 Tax=Aspergillus cavernicola TaxID=176166 RepID=A0ABR4I9I4_9EURO
MYLDFFDRLKLLPAILAVCLASLPGTTCRPTARAQEPSTDPFYKPPAGFELEPPGAILRQRQVASSFLGLIADPVEAYQLVYRTTAIDGSSIAAVTTVFKPFHPMTDRFISFQTAYDSSSVTCEPSYQYQLGVVQTDLISPMEMFFIQRHILQGYVVASPDHEGPDAALDPGRLAGMVVLDGMRAVVNFQDTIGLSTRPPAIVGMGYSGGAIATGWAASLHSAYAPELNIKGWAQGGTPSNLTVGFTPAAIDGLCKPGAYGAQLQPVIDSIITEQGRCLLDFANSHCFLADLLNFANQSIFSTDVQTLGHGILQQPTIHSILAENILGANKQETPIAPVLIYHGTQNEVIPYSNATALVKSWWNNKASVTFIAYANHGHTSTPFLSLPDVGRFIESAFAGTVQTGCSSTMITSSLLDPDASSSELELAAAAVVNALRVASERDEDMTKRISVRRRTVINA